MAYTGSIDLISGIRQANGGTFPLVDATAVRVDDETRLDEALGNLDNEVVVSDTKFLLQAENVPDTVQTITFDGSGNVSQITHTANGTAVRTDTFTFGTGSITEVRTLATGEVMTIVTDTATLVTTVTYTAA